MKYSLRIGAMEKEKYYFAMLKKVINRILVPGKNIMGSFLAHVPSFHRISWKSAQQFMCDPANKQINKKTTNKTEHGQKPKVIKLT